MDHYCIWLNLTIGSQNHRTFVVLLLAHFVAIASGKSVPCAVMCCQCVLRCGCERHAIVQRCMLVEHRKLRETAAEA